MPALRVPRGLFSSSGLMCSMFAVAGSVIMAPAPRTQNRESETQALSALALVGSVGLTVAMPIVAGVVVGVYLGGGLVLIGTLMFGLAGGLYGAYRILIRDVPWNR